MTPSETDAALNRAIAGRTALTAPEMRAFLSADDAGVDSALFSAAREVKARCGKTAVLPRGLIETSNVCRKNCLYCGIRRDQGEIPRYRLAEADIGACVAEAQRRGWTAVAFQAGEVESEANTAFYERLLRSLPPSLEVTLSLGEQTEDVYRRWKDAAGRRVLRYLIRIEASSRELYAKIHPHADSSFERRLACIRTLKRLGYVTGSGVMIGLPWQTAGDLAADIAFFGREGLDMVGMGPYIPVPGTPLRAASPGFRPAPLSLALRMIALTRLYLHDVNIVAATALEALSPGDGRERGIAAGANVVMTDLTPPEAKAAYALYPGKATAR